MFLFYLRACGRTLHETLAFPLRSFCRSNKEGNINKTFLLNNDAAKQGEIILIENTHSGVTLKIFEFNLKFFLNNLESIKVICE